MRSGGFPQSGRMPGTPLVAPSILSCDFAKLGEEVAAADAAGADWIHLDVMDGRFVPNLTMGPAVVEAVRRSTSLPLDVHLMIEEPEAYLAPFVDAGANFVTVHAEASAKLPDAFARIRDLGARPGVAINPNTAVRAVEPWTGLVDLVVLMSVHPGFGGQAYIEGSTERVRELRALLDRAGSGAHLEVDGGVDGSNAGEILAAGASVLVAGSAVYGHPDGPAAGIRRVRPDAATAP